MKRLVCIFLASLCLAMTSCVHTEKQPDGKINAEQLEENDSYIPWWYGK